MEERRRRAYLQAMGIPNWQPREAVAGADIPVDPVPPESAVQQHPPASMPVSEPMPTWMEDIPPPAEEFAPTAEPHDFPDELAFTGSPAASLERLGWEQLEQRVKGCDACELHKSRSNTVFGVGDREASLMVIGEAPGADEDRQGEPFVGRAGQLLNAMFQAIGLERGEVFIANILKCRPPGNRDPRIEEVLHCEPYLHRQVALVQPKVILAVGRVAAQNLLKSEQPVGKLRGRDFSFDNIPVIVTYHPAYLLRSPDQKGKAWQDLQRALQLLRH